MTTPTEPESHNLDSLLVPEIKQNGQAKRPAGHSSAADNGQTSAWEAWVGHLLRRKKPLPLAEIVSGGGTCPLLWAFPRSTSPETVELVEDLFGLKRKVRPGEAQQWNAAAQAWLAESDGTDADDDFALQCLGWCHALPRLAARLSERTWWDVLRWLVRTAADSQRADADLSPLTTQLLAGELALSLAYLFPEIPACRQLSGPAGKTLSEGLDGLLDGEGLPHASQLPVLRQLLACWTRCGFLDRSGKPRVISKAARHQYQWLIRQALRLTRFDGRQVFETISDAALGQEELFDAVLDLDGDDVDGALADVLLRDVHSNGKKRNSISLPPAAEHSEWSEVAVLRGEWTPEAPFLTVAYDHQRLVSELSCQKQLIWSGSWDAEVRVDGKMLEVRNGWEEICWESDRDVDYVELEADLTDGWRCQRQILLARDDGFLFVADAILGNSGNTQHKLEYRSQPPLVDGVHGESVPETREVALHGRKRIGTVLPLALSEWRSDPRGGSLSGAELQLRLQAVGRAIYAPLFIDVNPKRARKPLTWRRLTVAEQLQIVAADVAVGYRVQIGKHQWLFYRSLAPAANRTLLGQNLSTEFFAARIQADGETETLIEIE